MDSISKYFKKRLAAFKFAFLGLGKLISREAHMKIHLLAALCVIIFAIVYRLNSVEWCLCLICIGAVCSAEAFNTALEKLCDRVSRERHPLIGAAKDVAAAGVLIAALISVAVGLIIFIPKIF